MTGSLRSSALVESDADRVREAMAGVLASAVATLRDFEPGQRQDRGGTMRDSVAHRARRCPRSWAGSRDHGLHRAQRVGNSAEIYFASEGRSTACTRRGRTRTAIPRWSHSPPFPPVRGRSRSWKPLPGARSPSPARTPPSRSRLLRPDGARRSCRCRPCGFTVPVGEDASSVTSVAEAAIEHLTRGRPARSDSLWGPRRGCAGCRERGRMQEDSPRSAPASVRSPDR